MDDLFFQAGIDRSKFKNDLDGILSDIQGVTSSVKISGEELDKLFSGNIVDNIKEMGLQSNFTATEMKNAASGVMTFVSEMEAGLKTAVAAEEEMFWKLTKLKQQLGSNSPEVKNLQSEYDSLKVVIGEYQTLIDAGKQLVEEYGQNQQTLQQRLSEVKKEMQELRDAGRQNSEHYANLRDEAAHLGKAIKDVNTEVNGLTKGGLTPLISVLNTVAGSVALGAGAVGLFSENSERFKKVTEKINEITAIAVGVQSLYTSSLSTGTSVMNFFSVASTRLSVALGISTGAARIFLATLSGGLILIIPALILLYEKFTDASQRLARVKNDINDATKEGIKNASQEVVKLDQLYKAATNVSLSIEQRKKAALELQKTFPQTFANASTELIMNGKLENSYYTLRRSIIAAATAKAAQAKIDKLGAEYLQDEMAIREKMKEAQIQLQNAKGGSYTVGSGQGTKTIFISKEQAQADAKNAFNYWYNQLVDSYKKRNKDIGELTKFKFSQDDMVIPEPPKEVKAPTIKNTGSNGTKNTILDRTPDDVVEEILPKGSVAEIRKRLSEIDDELEKATDINIINKKKVERIATAKELAEAEAKIATEAKKEEISEIQKQFDAILKEQQTYQEKSDALKKEWEDMKSSDQYKNASQSDKDKIDKSFSNRQGKLDMGMIQETAEWQVAFSELEGMSETSLQAILARLLEFKEKSKGTLSLSDAAELQKAIDKVNAASNKNPFAKLSSTFTNYRTSLKASKKAQDDYNNAQEKFGKGSKEAIAAGEKSIEADKKALDAKKALVGQLQEGQDVFNAVGNGVMELADAFGGFDDATSDAIGNIMAIGNAALDLGKSIASGDVAGMIKAGIQLIASIGKALSGDQKKEREIKKQAAALKELETAYSNLAFAAERAFGSQKYDGQRDLIKNLEQQKIALETMMRTEESKKKADKGKIADYKEQINQINQSITQLKEGIIKDVLQTEIPDMASKIGDALLDAFGKGEDGINAINSAFNDMVKNILRNQLNKVLEAQMKPIYENMLKAAGFNADGSGAFDGLTTAEIEDLRAQVQNASKQGQSFIDAYSEIFKGLGGADAQGLKGDIKGVTEKTAGALEAQINTIRTYQVEGLNIHKKNQTIFADSLRNLVMIESNTRNLIQIRQDIAEMNGKMKASDLRASGLN